MKQQSKNLIKYVIPAVIGQICFFWIQINSDLRKEWFRRFFRRNRSFL